MRFRSRRPACDRPASTPPHTPLPAPNGTSVQPFVRAKRDELETSSDVRGQTTAAGGLPGGRQRAVSISLSRPEIARIRHAIRDRRADEDAGQCPAERAGATSTPRL